MSSGTSQVDRLFGRFWELLPKDEIRMSLITALSEQPTVVPSASPVEEGKRDLVERAMRYAEEERKKADASDKASEDEAEQAWHNGQVEAYKKMLAYLGGLLGNPEQPEASPSAPVPCHYCNMLVEHDYDNSGVHATNPAVESPWLCPANPESGTHLIATTFPIATVS